MNFLFNFVFEKIVVAIISRKNRKATNWVSRPRMSRTALRSNRPIEELCDVVPPDVLAVLRLGGVVQHDETIRTRGRDRIRVRLFDVAQATVVNLLPAFLHPHAGASCPAAEPAVAGL